MTIRHSAVSRRARPILAVSFVLALFLAALAVHDTSAVAQTMEECGGAWETAPASSTCDITVLAASGAECGIAAICDADDGTTELTSISLALSQFPQLRNCSGTLTVSASSC